MSKYQELHSKILPLIQYNLNNTQIAKELFPDADFTELETIRKQIGKIRNKDLENRLRDVAQWWWFKNTTMVFEK